MAQMRKETQTKQLVGPDTIAAAMNVTRNTVLNWSNRQQIPCVRIGNVFRYDLEEVSKSVGYDFVSLSRQSKDTL